MTFALYELTYANGDPTWRSQDRDIQCTSRRVSVHASADEAASKAKRMSDENGAGYAYYVRAIAVPQ